MKRVFQAFGLILGGVLILALLDVPLLVPFVLLTGWFESGARLWSSWHPAVVDVAIFGVAAVVLGFGVHAFACWLRAAATAKEPAGDIREWSWRWTVAGLGIVGCSLMALIAVVLITHQTYWLRTSRTPWLSSSRDWYRTDGAALKLGLFASSVGWDTAQVKEYYERASGESNQAVPLPELFEAVWISKSPNHLDAVVLIPRRSLVARWARVAVVKPDVVPELHAISDLRRVLASLGVEDGGRHIQLNAGGGL